MKKYLVGGAVRDQLLNIPIKDHDWLVVGSTPEEMKSLGYMQVGSDFPVFLHPDSKEEYALARTERKSGHGYQGFTFDTSKSVSLEEDLLRRDLTINAMVIDEEGKLIDPYGGQKDLESKILRHVSEAFTEDPLRVLRVARFAARFAHLGFKIAPETLSLMTEISDLGELDHLTPERVWQETERALSERSPWVYFDTLKQTNCLSILFPELDALFGVPQPEKYHPEIDTGVHSLLSLERACEMSTSTTVRFSALLHDLGKALTPQDKWPSHYGHEKLGLKPIKKLSQRSKVPNQFKELALLTSEFHTHIHRAFELRSDTILKVLKACDAFRKPERFKEMLICCKADARGRSGFESIEYEQADFISNIFDELSQITTKKIVQQGFKGKEIGEQLDIVRIKAISDFKAQYQN